MPKKVDIQGIGPVEFDDDMTDAEITHAIETDILPAWDAKQGGDAAAHAAIPASSLQIKNPSEYAPESPAFKAKYGPGELTVMERIGRGASDVTQGIAQDVLNVSPTSDVSMEEIRAYATPEQQKLSDAELRALFETEQANSGKDYTAKVNDELALYNKGREAQGGGFDAARVAGNVLATAPLAVGGGTGVVGRAVQGAKAGALGGAVQFDESGSLAGKAKQVGTGAAVGAVLAPVVGAVTDRAGTAVGAIKDKVRGLVAEETGKTSEQAIIQAVPEIAALPAPERTAIMQEAQDYIAAKGELDPVAFARKANLIAQGVKPTQAMVTRSPRDWTVEENLRRTATASTDANLGEVAQDLNAVRLGNDQALTTKLQSFGAQLPKGSAEAHGQKIMQSLDELATASQKEVGEFYSAVRDARGGDLASDARTLHATLDDLRDNTYAEKLVSSVTNKLKRFGMIDAEGNLTSNSLTVSQSEELRKFVNRLPNDFGKQDIIRAIDSDVMESLGDDAFKTARGAAAARFKMLGNPATQRALDALGELKQGKTAQGFIRSQVVNAPAQDLKSLVETLGKLPAGQAKQANDAIKAGVLGHLEEAAVNRNSGQFSGAKFNDALNEIGDEKLTLIFGAAQTQQLRNLGRAALDATFAPPYSSVNYSGSGTFIASLMDKLANMGRYARVTPVLGNAIKEGQAIAAENAKKSALATALAGKVPVPKAAVSLRAQQIAKALERIAPAAGGSTEREIERQRKAKR